MRIFCSSSLYIGSSGTQSLWIITKKSNVIITPTTEAHDLFPSGCYIDQQQSPIPARYRLRQITPSTISSKTTCLLDIRGDRWGKNEWRMIYSCLGAGSPFGPGGPTGPCGPGGPGSNGIGGNSNTLIITSEYST